MITIRLIALDIDGTILRPDGTLSPRVHATVNRVGNTGVSIVLATARSPERTLPILSALSLTDPVISCGGALVTKFGMDCPILTCTVPIDPGTRLLEEAIQRQLPVLVAERERFLVPPSILDIHGEFFTMLGFHIQETRESISALVKNALFLRVLGEDSVRALLEACPPTEYPELSFVQYSFHGIADLGIYNAQASKGNALRILLGVLGISPADTLAIGDSQADRSLLLAATWRIAMGNANADLKEIATWIAPSNAEDGAAIALERWVLQGETQRSSS